jgi:acyl-coenzyme A synthetase/AMP-(fatty) acid ligase
MRYVVLDRRRSERQSAQVPEVLAEVTKKSLPCDELNRCLPRTSAVAECAANAAPDEIRGEILEAFVLLAESRRSTTGGSQNY